MRRPYGTLLYAALLAALPFVVYSNNYTHAYHLDDTYTVVTNPHVRSLRAIPSYFTDPATYTSIREQADYRPVLQLTYALNYRMGAYETWWWHFTQVALHALVTLGIYALCRRVLAILQDPRPDGIAFVAAAIFAVHPAASGVVNYFNARSSLLTAAFLLPALLAYMKPAETPGYARPQWKAALLYALAIFTKVEAVGVLGAFWAFDLWQRGCEAPNGGLIRAIRSSFDRRTLRRLLPALIVTAIYFVIRARVMAPFPFADSRHAADVGAYEYFITQLTAWWYYIYRWVAPVRLVSDYLAYPVYRSWTDPVVLLAAGAWIAVSALLVVAWKRAPYLLFLAIASLALLGPTSSVAALAEMVNEHRPYLPIGILSLAAVIPIGRWMRDSPGDRPRALLGMSGAVLFLALCTLTYRRNDVFSTKLRFWQDVLAKAPSSRAHLNYGVALMELGDMPGALRQFHRSLDLAPSWYYTHLNLGVAHQHLGQVDSARTYFDRAVRYDRYSGLALTWRGEFQLAQHDYRAALDDFSLSLPLGLQLYRNVKGLATAHAGLGDVDRCLEQADRMLSLDRASALADIPAIANSFPASVREQFYAALQARVPGHAWGAADPSRPTAPEQLIMARGLDALGTGQPAAAAAAFREVLAVNPSHYGAHYQLAVALDRLGQTTEARTLWVKVLRLAESYGDQTTMQTARTQLAR